METDVIDKIAVAVAAKIVQPLPDDRLWGYKELGVYFGCAPRNAAARIATKPDFPAAIFPSGQPRWNPEDVKKWAAKQK